MFSCRLPVLTLLFATFLLAACSDSSGGAGSTTPGPCETDPIPAACNQACSNSLPCPSGYFCDTDNTCNAECTPSGNQCGDTEECDGSGQCVGGDDGGDGVDDGGDDGDCPAVQVDVSPVIPVVTLLIDQSASMRDDFGGVSRWDALNTALIGNGNDGLLFDLQSSIDMGVSLYTSINGNPPCPQLASVDHSVNNAQDIAALLQGNQPVDDTPTGEAVRAVTEDFPASDNPRIIVLATDGLPDRCGAPDAHDDVSRANVETAVQDAFTSGIETFVLSIGPEVAQDHLQRVANAGQGLDLATGDAEFFTALDPDALADAFETIIRGIRSCEIEVDGQVDVDRADEGTVIMNGTELEFGTDWQMLDESTIILLGDACTTFQNTDTVSLSAEFACGSVIVVD